MRLFLLAAIGCCMCAVAQEPGAAPAPTDTSGPADLAAALATIAGWEKQHSELVRRVEIGKSVGERPLFVLRIGTAADGAPEVYVGGGIHGFERSEQDALFMVEQLLQRRSEPMIAALLRSRVLWVQPMINPDSVVARERKNANGVDLNRNFSVRWRTGPKSTSVNHPGSAAFSEPETRAIREFLLGRTHLRACLDLHRSTDLLIAAKGGGEGVVEGPVLAAFGPLRAAVGWGSRDGTAPAFPTVNGLFIDWAWVELGTVAFAMENRGDPLATAERDPRWRCLLHLLEKCAEYPESRAAASQRYAPKLVTSATRKDAKELARLQRPGTVMFRERFEDEASLGAFFELGGQPEGRLRIAQEAGLAHTGNGALQLTATDSGGSSSGASAVLWLGDEGHDCVHLRYWIRYAEDYDQGNLNHTGGSLEGVAGNFKWTGMGKAGLRPLGDDHCNARVEGWRDWQRIAAPGALQCYVYWMDMLRDRDGNWWGNLLGPAAEERVVPARGKWQCVELRMAANTSGAADGEMAVWLDGVLYLHYQGIRWRKTAEVRIKRATLMVYVHQSRRDNRVWYDDVIVSTGYVGTGEPAAK